MTTRKKAVETEQPFMDVLSGECRALAERYKLTKDQYDILLDFVTTVAMRSWRNGRTVGWTYARERATEISDNRIAQIKSILEG